MFLHVRAQYFNCNCHVSENVVKTACGQEEAVQLGDASRGFGRHANG